MASGFRKDVQGLRAVAVLAVLAYHLTGGSLLPGGFAGVDVFFVISGFLITTTILRDHRHGRWSLREFYRRRCRRILPAGMLMLAVVLIAGGAILSPEHYQSTAKWAFAALFFFSNHDIGMEVGYFAPAAELKPLLHTWSLSVEEQFYLLFPLVLGILLSRAPRRVGLFVTLGVLLSLGYSVVAAEVRPALAFNAMPSRAFELGAGALLAFRPNAAAALPPVLRRMLGLLGLVCLGLTFTLLDTSVQWPGLPALAPTLGTLAVLAAGAGVIGSALLSSGPMQMVGGMSYSLYLWHWPILVLCRHWLLGPLSWLQISLVLIATFVVSWASWNWIEKPFLRGAPRQGTIRTAAIATVALAAAAWMIVSSGGMPGRFGAGTQAAFAARANHNPQRSTCHRGHSPGEYSQTCLFGAEGAPGSVAVWGDSHGAELAFVLGEALGARGGAVRQITSSSCPPTLRPVARAAAGCLAHNRKMLDALVADHDIMAVVLTAYYGGYETPSEVAAAVAEIALKLDAAGKVVVLLEPQPIQSFDPPAAVGMRLFRRQDPATWGVPLSSHQALSAHARNVLRATVAGSRVHLVDPLPVLCTTNLCEAWSAPEGVLYFDATHLSLSGAGRLEPLIVRAIYSQDTNP